MVACPDIITAGDETPMIFEVFEQCDAVAAGHHHIGENQIEALGFGEFQRARGVIADRGFVPGEPKGARQRGERVRVVVNDKDVGFERHGRLASSSCISKTRGILVGLCGGFAGRSMWKDVPTPVFAFDGNAPAVIG